MNIKINPLPVKIRFVLVPEEPRNKLAASVYRAEAVLEVRRALNSLAYSQESK
jgi:hypothetical protein